MSHRNEPARARRRQQLKEQLSLVSIPLAELPSQKYCLENHFGWQVLQKCRVGDGMFPPYLLHCMYCNKPHVPSGDDKERDKVVYVLYIRGKDTDIGDVDVKETQTAFSVSVHEAISRIIESAPPPTPKKKKGKKKHAPERRKVISDFYYIPIKERVMMKYNIGPYASGDEGDGTGRPKYGRGRKKPKAWQLRAGAENPEDDETTDSSEMYSSEEESEEDEDGEEREEEREEEKEEVIEPEKEKEEEKEKETPNKIRDTFKKYDCTECLIKSTDAELMDSPKGSNKFLYLPKERYEKRHRNISEQDIGNTE